MADAGVQPNAATFHLLAWIYEEHGMQAQLAELKQLQHTIRCLEERDRGTC